MNLAIMTCKKKMEACTGVSCMEAFQNKEKSFARYAKEETVLKGFMDCGGCEIYKESDNEILKKRTGQLLRAETATIHLSGCISRENCPCYNEIIANLKNQMINVANEK